jgi:hypothetical protein
MSDADVRARLRAYREAVMRREPSADAWPRLQRRLRREPWRRAGLAAAAVALVVAVATVGPGLAARWTRGEPTTAGKPARPTVAARIPLGCSPRTAEVGFGAVWVGCPGAVIRIDPATNRIAAVIPLQLVDDPGIAFSHDAVWVSSGWAAHPVVYRLDPARNREVSQTPLPGGAGGIVPAEGAIWVVQPQPNSDPAKSGPGTLARLNPKTGGLLRPVRLPSPPTGIRAGFGAIWVTTLGDGFAVYRIDPRARTVTRVPRAKVVVAAGPDSLWVGSDNPLANLHRVDPGSGRVVATVPVPGVKWMAFGLGALWAATDAKLYRLDPNSARVVGAPVALQGPTAALAVGEGSIWVGQRATEGRDSAITRLNLAP